MKDTVHGFSRHPVSRILLLAATLFLLPTAADAQLTQKDLRRSAGVYRYLATGWIKMDGKRERIRERGRERMRLNGNSPVQVVDGGSYEWDLSRVRVGYSSIRGSGRIFGTIINEDTDRLERIGGSFRFSMRIIGQGKRKYRIRARESVRFGSQGSAVIRLTARKG